MTTAVLNKTVNRAATTQPTPAAKPVRAQLQSSLKVSRPDDPLEREADQTAKRVMRSPYAARFHDTAAGIQRKNVEAQPDVSSNVAADIQSSMASGEPLPLSVRRFMEPRFGADFENVRTHTGDNAAGLNRQLSAHAFTVGDHIFFGKGKFQPETAEGKELIAHELTHTIQQGTGEKSPARVQRLGLSDALDYFADKANMIPGFRMFTIVLGVNPINMSTVDRSPGNILRAVIEFLPGGGLITQALENHGVFDKVGNWVEQQIRTLGMVGASIKQAVTDFLDSLSWTDIFDLGGVWERAKRIFTEPIDRIIDFVKGLVTGIIKFIKDAILLPLASLAEGTRGYDLLKAVLGEDPITGEPVPQTAETLIGGFMKLIGQEEVWENLKKSNAIARAWAWFQGALAAVKGFVQQIPGLFIAAFQSLEIADIILVPRAFAKVAAVFGSFIGSFLSWAGNAVWNLLEIIFDVVSPGAFSYVKRTGAALKSILKNPLPFVGNLVKAAKLGFQNFAANIGAHFKAGLIDWLTGSLPGVYIPRSFDFGELVKFVFSVLGLTWQNIRTKLVKAVGETTVKVLETGFDIVVTLVTQGPAAAWEKIKEQLANLKDMVIGGITDFVVDMVVKKAVPKLIAMFIPGAGFLSAILSIYDTIMVFVNKISKIIQVVTGFINSIVAIASGAIGAAAAKVESTLAGLLALAISFLAGFAGLGKVSDKVMGVINKVRAPIDKALDWLVNWIVTMAKKLGKFAVGAVKGLLNWGSVKSTFSDDDGKSHTIQVSTSPPFKLMIASNPQAAAEFLTWYVGKKGADFEKDNKPLIAEIRGLIGQAQAIVTQIETTEKARKDDPKLETLQRDLLTKNVALSGKLSSLVGSDRSIGKAKEKYKLEGLTGTYGSMPKPPGDSFTADHQPQAAILQAAAEFDYFSDTGELAKRAAGRAKQGFAINLHSIRHIAGRTFGSKGKKTKESFLAEIKRDTKGKMAAEKRAIAVAKIKADLLSDVKAIQGVVGVGSANWDDIRKELPGKKEDKDKLVADVSGRIVSGEAQVAAQDIDFLLGPALPAPAAPTVRRKASSSVQLQSSLRVSKPEDREEKEADQTAKKVMRMAAPQSPYIARFQTAIGTIQRRTAGGLSNGTAAVATGIQYSMGSGSPLPSGVQRFMEPRFGADFKNVRIHTGDNAVQLSQDLNAQAFTVGSHIFFGKGKFQPESHDGRELIAHELSHTMQQGTGVHRRIVDVLGKKMYVTGDNRLVELPSDLSDEEATRLETEAKAGEKKLGKGPAPKPVPDARKLAPKEEKKEKLKLESKGKRTDKGRSRGMAAAGAAAAAMLKNVGKGKVAQYLAVKGLPSLTRGVAGLHKLKQNEQTHDDAAEKLKQTEKAVVIPPSDEQSKSNAGQVNVVSARPAPPVDENKGKQKLQESLKANVPRTVEDVDNFKRDMKAQHMGADVMGVVLGDKNNVVSTFGDMKVTPPPTPSGHIPEDLPPREIAPATAAMNLGLGAIAPLQKEHTDVTSYTKEADGKLKEEGVTQEQLDMVDSGELADANKEKKGLEKTARTEPAAVQGFARQQTETIDKDLRQEEKQERNRMTVKRNAGLGVTAAKQKTAKTALQRKREEVAAQINGMFQSAQDKVKKKLADLETESMKRFDDGNTRATKEFEDNVNREIDAFKDDRYSGWFGWARKVRDWWKGIDDLPQVKTIFENNRTTFVNTINKLVETISADNKKVIKECTDELAAARKKIKEFVDGLEPGLKDIGKKSAEEVESKLADLDQFISQRQEELQNKLKDKQTAAIKAIDEKIEKMKEAMAGALAKLGKLLLWAAKKFFTWALEKFGVSLSTIESIISKGVAVLKAIFTGPIQFVKNLINAASTGFANFGKNFLTHLKNAVFEWLTGSLEGVILPQSWDLKGILSVIFQMLGLTWQNVRAHLVELIPEPAVKVLETSFTLVKTLISEGPMAAWEQLKDIAGEMKDAFVDAVKDWIKWKVVEEAIKTVMAMFIPGAGIVRAVIGIYDTIVFFIKKAKDIIQMVGNFLGSIAEIAAGNIGAAADALENGLARALKLVIEFLARFLRLSGITDKIREVLQKIRGKVNNVLRKVATWIVDKGKALWRGAKAGVKSLLAWWKAKKTFKAGDGQTHTLYFAGEERGAVLMVQSAATAFSDFVSAAQPGSDTAKILAKTEAVKIAGQIDSERNTPPTGSTPDQIEDARAKKATRVNELLELLQPHAAVLFSATVPNSAVAVNGKPNSVGLGVSMKVKPLTNKKRPEGSDPTSSPNTIFDALNERRNSPGGASYYIKGHLLNQKLGGPGAWANLTPLSRSGNKQHELQAEDVVKRTVDLSATVEYNVTPAYAPRSDKSALLTEINNSLDPPLAKQVKTRIVSAEDWAPDSMRVEAYFLDASLKQKNTIMDKTVVNPVERKLTSYYLSSTPKPDPVNLNVDDAAKIATIPGIGDVTARALVKVRKKRAKKNIFRFASFKQIADLVPGIGEARLKALKDANYVDLF